MPGGLGVCSVAQESSTGPGPQETAQHRLPVLATQSYLTDTTSKQAHERHANSGILWGK